MRIDNPYEGGSGRWYRGALHVHADGDEAGRARHYRDRRFDFACFNRRAPAEDGPVVEVRDFLVIDGLEIGDPPVTVLGNRQPLPGAAASFPLRRSVEFARGQKAFSIVCHPMASRLDFDTLREADGGDAIEIFTWRDAEQTNAWADQLWDLLLRSGCRTWGVAADHSHSDRHTGRGWVMVQAPLLESDSILEALRAGRFYASTGPYLHEFTVTEEAIALRCSPAERVEFVTGNGAGAAVTPPPRSLLDKASFPLKKNGGAVDVGGYVRVEVHGAEGARAWTNPIFIG